MKDSLVKIFNRPILIQIIFWTVYYFFETKHRPEYLNNDLIYFSALAETLFYAFVININIYVLLPKLFHRNRYIYYFLSLLAIMFISVRILLYLDSNFFYFELDLEAVKQFWNNRIDIGMSPMKVLWKGSLG